MQKSPNHKDKAPSPRFSVLPLYELATTVNHHTIQKLQHWEKHGRIKEPASCARTTCTATDETQLPSERCWWHGQGESVRNGTQPSCCLVRCFSHQHSHSLIPKASTPAITPSPNFIHRFASGST